MTDLKTQATPEQLEENIEVAYSRIDRFLRDNLDDEDYAEFSTALDAISSPAQQPTPPEQSEQKPLLTRIRQDNLVIAAVDLIAAIEAKHDMQPWPIKYGVPYREVNALRNALQQAPPPTELTDEEILAAGYNSGDPDGLVQFARRVLAAQKGKAK